MGVAALVGSAALAAPSSRQVQIYDDGKYDSSQLESLVKSPYTVTSPSYGRDGEITIPKSRDGHYQVHGFVNGFPLLFMVDTGASLTTIPLRFARASGIRAGIVQDVQTGAGVVQMGVSEGNRVGVGQVALDGMKVAVSKEIPVAVLGMNSLQRFRINIDEHGTMTLRPIR
jgi:aspartyl protease family protein